MKPSKIALLTGLVLTVITPTLAFGQNALNPVTNTFEAILESFQRMVSLAIPISIGILFIAFVVGLIMYVSGLRAGDATTKKSGSDVMIGGIIALFIVSSIWGIISLMQRFFGIDERQGAIQGPIIEGLPTDRRR
jgi:hypothetical protein